MNTTLAPDGYERQVLTWNGTFPGPLIEADWGDTLVVHVTNGLENNGYIAISTLSTSIHISNLYILEHPFIGMVSGRGIRASLTVTRLLQPIFHNLTVAKS